MRWLDTFTEGMTLDEVEAALRAGGVDAKPEEGYFGPEIRFDDDGFHVSIDLDAESKRFESFGAWRELPLEDALRIVAAVGQGQVVAGGYRREHDMQIRWLTPRHHVVLSFGDDGPAHLRFDLRQADEEDCDGIALAAFEARLGEVQQRFAKTPRSDGERGAAVARWRAHLEKGHEVLAKFVGIVQRTTPDVTVESRFLDELAKDVEQLVAHAELFAGDDDWRDAIVVGERDDIPYGDVEQYGWRMELAGEGVSGPLDPNRRAVRLVEGPFAYGIHRVLRTAHELHAVRDWPVADVVVRNLVEVQAEDDPAWLRDYAPDWLRELGACVATLGETRVILRAMNGDVERIAALLTCARRFAMATPTRV